MIISEIKFLKVIFTFMSTKSCLCGSPRMLCVSLRHNYTEEHRGYAELRGGKQSKLFEVVYCNFLKNFKTTSHLYLPK